MSPRRGFTVAEMIIVLVIAGLLMAITLPKLSRTYDGTGVRAAKARLSSFIIVARAAAIRRGQTAEFRLNGNVMQVLVDSSGTFVSVRDSVSLYNTDKVTITARGVTGVDSILFNSRGFASNLSPSTSPRIYVITRGNSSDSLCVSMLGLVARRCGA